MNQSLAHSDQPVAAVARKDFIVLQQDLTVQQALDAIRLRDLGEKIIYFYIVDDRDRLVGVVPTRRLLTAAIEEHISDIMVQRIITIPDTATILDACEFFVLYRFLAFPVIDGQHNDELVFIDHSRLVVLERGNLTFEAEMPEKVENVVAIHQPRWDRAGEAVVDD